MPNDVLTLTVTHDGHVRVKSCEGCTGKRDEVIAVLERVIEVIRDGTDENGVPIPGAVGSVRWYDPAEWDRKRRGHV